MATVIAASRFLVSFGQAYRSLNSRAYCQFLGLRNTTGMACYYGELRILQWHGRLSHAHCSSTFSKKLITWDMIKLEPSKLYIYTTKLTGASVWGLRLLRSDVTWIGYVLDTGITIQLYDSLHCHSFPFILRAIVPPFLFRSLHKFQIYDLRVYLRQYNLFERQQVRSSTDAFGVTLGHFSQEDVVKKSAKTHPTSKPAGGGLGTWERYWSYKTKLSMATSTSTAFDTRIFIIDILVASNEPCGVVFSFKQWECAQYDATFSTTPIFTW